MNGATGIYPRTFVVMLPRKRGRAPCTRGMVA